MIKNLLSLYYHRYPKALVSLMQSSRYNAGAYVRQLHKTKDFTLPLEQPVPRNRKAAMAMTFITLGMLVQVAAGILVIVLGINHHIAGGIFFGIAIILLYPLVWAYLGALALVLRAWYKTGLSLDKAE